MSVQCPQAIVCPGTDSPFLNLTSEGPEPFNYFSVVYNSTPPQLGFDFTATGCVGECTSTISQQDADNCAALQAYQCQNVKTTDPGTPPTPNQPTKNPPIFLNQEQACTVVCKDGLSFSAILPAGLIAADSQKGANNAAYAQACALANSRKICLSDLDQKKASIGFSYSGKITATGSMLATPGGPYFDTWSIIDGSLPPGLVFNGGPVQGGTVTITGKATTKGTYKFMVQIVDPLGDYQRKAYQITVADVPASISVPFAIYDAPSYPCHPVAGTDKYATSKCTISVNTPTFKMWSTDDINGTPIGGIVGRVTVYISSPVGGPIKAWVVITLTGALAFQLGIQEYDMTQPTSSTDPTGTYVRGNAHGLNSDCTDSPLPSLTITAP